MKLESRRFKSSAAAGPAREAKYFLACRVSAASDSRVESGWVCLALHDMSPFLTHRDGAAAARLAFSFPR